MYNCVCYLKVVYMLKYIIINVGETTIWLLTTTLKTGICDVMSNALKDLSVSFSSPINFEIEQ